MTNNYLYMLGNIHLDRQRNIHYTVKIGFARNPFLRLRAYITHNPGCYLIALFKATRNEVNPHYLEGMAHGELLGKDLKFITRDGIQTEWMEVTKAQFESFEANDFRELKSLSGQGRRITAKSINIAASIKSKRYRKQGAAS